MKKREQNSSKTNSKIVTPSQRINELFERVGNFRFIQKICRPLSSNQKSALVHEFGQIMRELHENMENLSKQNFLYRVHPNQKNNQSLNINSMNYKHNIQRIGNKYNEIFRNGNFKFYEKIAKIYQLPPMTAMNTDKWSHQALKGIKNDSCCC